VQLETVLENFAATVRQDVDALRTEIDDLKRENTELKAELANVKGSNANLKKIVDNYPAPKDGKDADPIAILNHVENIIDKRVAQIELKQGPQGPQGERGEKGDTGARGEKGPKGDAGVGIHKSWIDQEGCLVQLLTNEREDNLGPVVGPEGPAGRDALGVGDFKAAFDGRNFTIGLSNGVISKTEQFYLPIPMPAGKYESEKDYFAGDIVRYKGSSYIAGGIPSDRPGFDDVWFMLAEKGKDGPKGDKGEEGKPGRAGMDLTHVDSQGNKFG